MSTQQHVRRDPMQSRALLFRPVGRLGWEFRDRNRFVEDFREPPPPQPVPNDALYREAHAAALDHKQRVATVLKFGGGSVLLLLLLAANAGAGPLALAVLVALGCGGAVLATHSRKTAADRAADGDGARQGAGYENAYQAWEQRRHAHHAEQMARVGRIDEWGSVLLAKNTQRFDVIGGSRRSREAFLTVFGASTVCVRPVILLDLTGHLVCRPFTELAAEAGVPVDFQLLPRDLARTTLLDGLERNELANALVESVHGDNPGVTRGIRSMDVLLLKRLCEALGEDLSMARIGAGLQALKGEPDTTGALTRQEYNRIADELFSDESRRHDRPSLHQLLSFVDPLRSLGTERESGERAHLTCMAMGAAGASAHGELLTDLMIQWVTRQIGTFGAYPPAVIVVGGEEIKRQHVEWLSNAAEGSGVQLTFLFSHLRDMTRDVAGSGSLACMKLGNRQEAEAAAETIGKEHSFTVTTLTRAIGGNETVTVGKTDGGSTTRGTSLAEGITWGTNWSRNSSESSQKPTGLSDLGRTMPGSTTKGHSHGGSRGGSRTTTTSDSTSTSWSSTQSQAEGSNWTTTEASSRVYDFAVEPGRIQAMQDFHLLFVGRDPEGRSIVHSVEFNPEIVTLDRMSIDPLPELEAPEPAYEPEPAPDPAAYPPPAGYGYPQQPPAGYYGGPPDAGYYPGPPDPGYLDAPPDQGWQPPGRW